MTTVRIAAAQTPEYRGRVDAALDYAAELVGQATASGVRLLCLPECYLQGYLLDPVEARKYALDLSSPEFTALIGRFPKSDVLIAMGVIELSEGDLFNTAVLIQNNAVVGRYRKAHLLKSESLFKAGSGSPVFELDGIKFGLNICFDTNFPEAAQSIANGGGTLLICLANNMMPRTRAEEYRLVHNAVRGERCRESGLWLISSDIYGERDDRVSWGPTAVLDPTGTVVAQLSLEQAGLLIYDLPKPVQQ